MNTHRGTFQTLASACTHFAGRPAQYSANAPVAAVYQPLIVNLSCIYILSECSRSKKSLYSSTNVHNHPSSLLFWSELGQRKIKATASLWAHMCFYYHSQGAWSLHRLAVRHFISIRPAWVIKGGTKCSLVNLLSLLTTLEV